MSFVEGPAQWRLPIGGSFLLTLRSLSASDFDEGFQAFFALCLLLQGMVLPDSPRWDGALPCQNIMRICQRTDVHTVDRWLIAHGRETEGLHVLSLLEDKAMDDPQVIEKKKEIEFSLAQESAGGA